MKNPLDHRLIEDCEIVRGLDEEVLQRKFYPILEKRINEDNCEEDILISNLQVNRFERFSSVNLLINVFIYLFFLQIVGLLIS